MSNAMTEEEVRTKFGDLFDTAYELLDNNDKHDLVMMILQGFAECDDDFKEFMAEVKTSCDHGQLHAHATIDVVLPVTHNSAAEMTRVLSYIFTALAGTELSNYRVRSGIEVDESAELNTP